MLNRRILLGVLATGSLASAAILGPPRVAITIDDFDWRAIPEPYRDRANPALLGTLQRHGIKAAAFVVGHHVNDDQGLAIVRQWSDAGHLIGNHTFSHHMLGSPEAGLSSFESDILRNEPIVSSFPAYRKFFRFPALKEGATGEVRDGMRAFLHAHQYRNGHVTIDASDWYYTARLQQRLEKEPAFDVSRYRAPYLAHIADRSTYYDRLARHVLAHTIPHTLLIHYNLLNVLFLDDLLSQYQQHGWKLVDAATAFRDPVFRSEPSTLPAGESLIWSLAKQTGRFDAQLRFPGEDEVYEKPLLDRLQL